MVHQITRGPRGRLTVLAALVGASALVTGCFADIDESRIPGAGNETTSGAPGAPTGASSSSSGGGSSGSSKGGSTDGAPSSSSGTTAETPKGPPGLVGYWTFEEPSGQPLDSSGKGNTGTLATSQPRIAGKAGNALQFRGGSDLFRVPGFDGAAFPKSGTLTFWFRSDASGTVDLFDVSTTTRPHAYIRLSGVTVVQAGLVASTAFSDLESVSRATITPTWSFVALRWGGRYGSIVVDHEIGMLDVGVTFDPSAQSFTMGRGFVGLLDEVRLFDRVLSDAEVVSLR